MSDVVLYPIRGQVSQVNGKNEYIVYVPRADEFNYGVVKVGKGLILEDGVISYDDTQVKIETIAKNGTVLDIVDKQVNITLDKTDVGLDNVDNTSDENKPVSIAAQAAIDSVALTAMHADRKLETHMIDYTNPHRVSKAQVGLDKVDNTSDKDKPISTATQSAISSLRSGVDLELNNIREKVSELDSQLKLHDKAMSFASYSDLVNFFNSASKDKFSVGESIFVNTPGVPDLWIYSVENSPISYTYSNDNVIVDRLTAYNFIQIGYYKLAPLEAQKIDLSNYVTTNTVSHITQMKYFDAGIGLKELNGGSTIVLENRVEDFALADSRGNSHPLVVNKNDKTMFVYDNKVATEKSVTDNFISYTSHQDLTEEQKEIARANIGAGTGSGGEYDDAALTAHINNQDNPHKVTKTQVGLSNVDNTADKDKPISLATQSALDGIDAEILTLTGNVERVEELVKQGPKAVSFANYGAVIDDFNMAATNKYQVGQTVLVNTTDVPDLWVYSVENTHVDYVYTNDKAITDALETTGFVQFGYYKLAQLETQKIDLDNYVTLNSYQNITGTKVFSEQIGILNGNEGEINYIKHINNNFLISSSDGENIVNIDEQLKQFNFYNKPLALEEYVDNNFISYTENQELTDEQKEIARNNIGAGGDVSVDYATDEKAGIIRIATNDEASSGSYDMVAVTPRQLATAINTSLGSVEAWLVDLNTGSGI